MYWVILVLYSVLPSLRMISIFSMLMPFVICSPVMMKWVRWWLRMVWPRDSLILIIWDKIIWLSYLTIAHQLITSTSYRAAIPQWFRELSTLLPTYQKTKMKNTTIRTQKQYFSTNSTIPRLQAIKPQNSGHHKE